jgi:hypothetical protein
VTIVVAVMVVVVIVVVVVVVVLVVGFRLSTYVISATTELVLMKYVTPERVG